MPELPEVEITYKGIYPWIVGHYINKILVRTMYLRVQVSDEICMLRNEYVINVYRRAKYLLFKLNYGWIIGHLGMTGRLKVLKTWQNPEKHDHLDFLISNKCIIRYTDSRRFGFWIWKNDIYVTNLLITLGIEPLSSEFNGHWLFNKSRDRHKLIKLWLMDAKIIAGIGNIYANESLFIAGILPYRLVSSLDEEEAIKLANSIKLVLSSAIRYGGTTFRDFLQSNGYPGYFIKKIQVYGRKSKPCLRCGNYIQYKMYGGRGTFFCLKCQS
ncbi:bifunctional DNA-formamidopyrimidine glycosylase/DNA-(apurinic or apyrimidinic site) lyase [Blochmannia endosymbiont of Camponotus (Colobopsis) obliquus]|uniref:bifunctional DNA-formamidopyrimidine glycosylase/DNA-(apurinic or apyrimidinic site) lyase n=1 Tax=Blochmannia endosymbiont of Camponotus (Colobopsis) obliquus TaxID=1505597 RepID=UPI00061A859D|nr:bifunctional DNA-formamidopyrimidine glycosylase/DNA-(apurinic or apyrimidinic site) lyase [Blochmannia endosymbiont of Camponotus (Colobopsis) obliquus]AKC60751.1 formamidopyrimidine-DNA glycosylase [Blochmannia endosymbiont of Camponotus (Colobopsis) obliquus]